MHVPQPPSGSGFREPPFGVLNSGLGYHQAFEIEESNEELALEWMIPTFFPRGLSSLAENELDLGELCRSPPGCR
jgi:hypothetical protein